MPTSPSRARRPTQSDVAALAGVSRSVVSAVINGPETQAALRVSPTTRDRVLAAVDQIGYIPNMAARSLASGRNEIIGVFTYDPIFPISSSSFYHDIVVGIEEEADRIGHSLLLSNARKDQGERSLYRARTSTLRVADGVIVIGGKVGRNDLAHLLSEGFPCVIVGRRELPGVEPSWVAPDYVAGARRLFEAVVEHGHERIGYVDPGAASEPALDRARGVTEAARGAGLSDQLITLPLGSGDELLQQVRDHRLTALLSASGEDATDTVLAARAAGMSVPGDLSVASMGGTPEGPRTIALAGLTVPRLELGREAVRILMALLDGSVTAPAHTVLECGLDLTATVGPPA